MLDVRTYINIISRHNASIIYAIKGVKQMISETGPNNEIEVTAVAADSENEVVIANENEQIAALPDNGLEDEDNEPMPSHVLRHSVFGQNGRARRSSSIL